MPASIIERNERNQPVIPYFHTTHVTILKPLDKRGTDILYLHQKPIKPTSK